MLTLVIPSGESYSEQDNCFVYHPETTIRMEHSLVSVSKWESKTKKAFFGKQPKTAEDNLLYIKCMTITRDVPDVVFSRLSEENIASISEYINDSMTATHVPELSGGGPKDTFTSELIYYMMFSYNIPLECEKWHVNRLLTLIKVFSHKNGSGQKMSRKDIASRNAALNAARRNKYKTKG